MTASLASWLALLRTAHILHPGGVPYSLLSVLLHPEAFPVTQTPLRSRLPGWHSPERHSVHSILL